MFFSSVTAKGFVLFLVYKFKASVGSLGGSSQSFSFQILETLLNSQKQEHFQLDHKFLGSPLNQFHVDIPERHTNEVNYT